MIEEMACIRKTYLFSEDQTEMKTFDCGVGGGEITRGFCFSIILSIVYAVTSHKSTLLDASGESGAESFGSF